MSASAIGMKSIRSAVASANQSAGLALPYDLEGHALISH
jgi:hypothetical protein